MTSQAYVWYAELLSVVGPKKVVTIDEISHKTLNSSLSRGNLTTLESPQSFMKRWNRNVYHQDYTFNTISSAPWVVKFLLSGLLTSNLPRSLSIQTDFVYADVVKFYAEATRTVSGHLTATCDKQHAVKYSGRKLHTSTNVYFTLPESYIVNSFSQAPLTGQMYGVHELVSEIQNVAGASSCRLVLHGNGDVKVGVTVLTSTATTYARALITDVPKSTTAQANPTTAAPGQKPSTVPVAVTAQPGPTNAPPGQSSIPQNGDGNGNGNGTPQNGNGNVNGNGNGNGNSNPNPVPGAGPAPTTISLALPGGATVLIPASNSGYVVGGTTLHAGGPIATVGGVGITINAGGPVVMNPGNRGSGPTPIFNPVAASVMELTPAATIPASLLSPMVTVGGHAIPITALPDGSSGVVVAGQTLLLGHSIVVNGQTLSLAPGGTGVIVNGQTQTLDVGRSSMVIAGQTLTPGGSIVVNGETMSLAPDGALVVGGQTLRSGSTVVVDGKTMSIAPGGGIVIAGQTLSVGQASGGTGVVIDGQTLLPGGSVVVDGTTLSLAPGGSGIVVGGSKTESIMKNTNTASPSGTSPGQVQITGNAAIRFEGVGRWSLLTVIGGAWWLFCTWYPFKFSNV
jgi:hypothetical protein